MAKNFTEDRSALGSGDMGFDITTSGAELAQHTRFVMVSEDGVTITGILAGQDTAHTTFGLKAGIPYPFRFKVISAVSTGSVKGYA